MPGIKRTRNQVKSQRKQSKDHSAKRNSTLKARMNRRETKAVAKIISRDTCRADSDADTVEMNVSIPQGVPVDTHIPKSHLYSIAQFMGNYLTCHLMYTDCKNNNNKFYIVQGVRRDSLFYLWTRWGRVGTDGQSSLKLTKNRYTLHNMYIEKLTSKLRYGYLPIELAYNDASKKPTQKRLMGERKMNSKLPKQVQDLMRFIFDTKLINQSVEKYGYNPKKLPLGKLSKDAIIKGYSTLKEIEKALKAKSSSDKLSKLSSEFYNYIPHNFGYQNMSNFVINTFDKLKEKLDLMDSLCDIRITAKISDSAVNHNQDEDELDVKYKKLKCLIEPLNPTSEEYKVLAKSLKVDKTESQKQKVKILEIFKLSKNKEEVKQEKKSDNKREVMWHGASFSRWGGILSKGLTNSSDSNINRSSFSSEPQFSNKPEQSVDFTRYYMSNNVGLLAL